VAHAEHRVPVGKQQMAVGWGEIDVPVLNRKPVFGPPDGQFAGSAGHSGKNANALGRDMQYDEDGGRDIPPVARLGLPSG